jgi:uracil phosphoribosyltransferase
VYSFYQTLLQAGVEEKRITFLNVLSCPEGLDALFSAHPRTYSRRRLGLTTPACVTMLLFGVADVKVVTAGVDRGLNEQKYLVPGIGDFGDRYFNTVHSHP